MLRCMQLAKNGLGSTYPNPLVGSVIVYEDQIIGEGWHRAAGEPHAEVIAIDSVKNKELLKKATLYVNLEPCNHFGKTPPCTNLILAMEIPKVVIGSTDPNPKVAGQGMERLRAGGCEVMAHVLKKDCDDLNKRFFTFHIQKRPYIILKWAQSQDGFIAPLAMENTGPVWITNAYTRQYVHKMRTTEQAILVGTQTALIDNPQLTARSWYGHQPVRLVLDRKLNLPSGLSLFDGKVPTLIISEKKGEFKENVSYAVIDFGKDVAKQVTQKLYEMNLQSLIVEGGTKTLNTFLEGDLWDEAYVMQSKTCFHRGIKAPYLNQTPITHFLNTEDTLFYYKNSLPC